MGANDEAGRSENRANSEVDVFVLADNASGETELLNYRMTVAATAYDDGDHFLTAVHMAREQGYENARAFDQHDPAGRFLVGLLKARAALAEVAATPKEGEPCTDSISGVKRWHDLLRQASQRLFEIIDKARAELGVASLGEAQQLGCDIVAASRSGIDADMSNFAGLSKPEIPRG